MKKLGMLFLVLLVSVASATPVTVVNGGFEDPQVAGWTQVTSLNGWTVETADYMALYGDHTEGSQGLYLAQGRIYQDFEGIGNPNTTYTLQVDASENSDGGYMTLYLYTLPAGNDGGFFYYQEYAPSINAFSTYTLSFTTGENVLPNQSVRLLIEVNKPFSDPTIDNVRLDAVPEPATIGLLIVGVLGLRRKK